VEEGHRSGTLGGLVIGVGMDGQKAERIRHGAHATGRSGPKLHLERSRKVPV
jgi:hypothetical protein